MASHETSSHKSSSGVGPAASSPKKTVSRSHLPLLLKKVDGEVFNRLIFENYGIELTEKEKSWFALDGKELKGSILPEHTRGEAVALVVGHEDRAVHQMRFFNGSKASEVAAVRSLLTAPLIAQKLTMDALHFKPDTLLPINLAGGIFLVNLKENQSELLAEMQFCSKQFSPDYSYESKVEKAHGREEQRRYWCYNIEQAYIDKRWEKAGFKYLIKVQRDRLICNKNKYSRQIAYFLSNKNVQHQDDAMDLFQAVRKHWQVEVANNARDCILKEDKLRCIYTDTNRTIALCRTLTIKLLKQSKTKNRCELMEYFADHFDQCILFLKRINFL